MVLQDKISKGANAFIRISPAPSPRAKRPEALQQIVNIIGDVLFKSDPPIMAKFVGCKIIHNLQTPMPIEAPKSGSRLLALAEDLQIALAHLAARGAEWRILADCLRSLENGLDWYRGSTGKYASVNFEEGHAHAVLAGPNGIEERSDVLLGISLMAPYTRFPDHVQELPTVVFPLSEGEFRSGSGEWFQSAVGSALYYSAGRQFAMRCTRNPLLLLWAQKTTA